jgi:hypothetical protein
MVKANLEMGQERMSFTSDYHVLVPVKSHLYRMASGRCRKRGQRRRDDRLRFFAAKTTAHPWTFYYHLVRSYPKKMRNSVLNFGRMLSG